MSTIFMIIDFAFLALISYTKTSGSNSSVRCGKERAQDLLSVVKKNCQEISQCLGLVSYNRYQSETRLSNDYEAMI